MKEWKASTWILSIVLTFLLTFLLADVWPNIKDSLLASILASTLLAVIWYSWETRKSRIQNEMTEEIRTFPWLKAASLKPEPEKKIPKNRSFAQIWWLPITNGGPTPAHDLRARWKIDVNGGRFENGFIPRDTNNRIDLVPNDTLHLELGRCLVGNDTTIDIFIEFTYRTSKGGRGKVTAEFHRRKGGWRNESNSPYEFETSDGTTFPISKS